MYRKSITAIIIVLTLLVIVAPTMVLAGAKNGTFMEWSWQGEKSGYFMPAKSGIVHFWSYDRPDDEPDIHYIVKSLNKFKNATECDEDAFKENPNWKPKNLYNAMYAEYKDDFKAIFPNLYQPYLLCGYAMD